MIKRFLPTMLMALAALMPLTAHADEESSELNCSVEVNAEKVNVANKEIFNTLKEAIAEYMNTTKWTDAQFALNEKIQCKLYLTISTYEDATGKMKGDLQIQSQRPVYNSSYTTTTINFKDTKVEFNYQEGNPLVYSELEMQDNLTAILNFYAFLIIGIDFDTFSLNGGDPYFEKAANVVRLAQSTGESGWKAFEDHRNRSAVLSVFTDKATAGFRELLYNYHRLGLDQMVVSVDKGRQTITKALPELKKIYDNNSMSVSLTLFRDAKLEEVINVYSKASSTEKDEVYTLLSSIYPADDSKIKQIKEESNN